MAKFTDRADRPPAFGVAVVDSFEVIWSRTEARGRGRLFEAGSISKFLTALVALELVDCAQLDLDRDVNERLRSWRLPGSSPVSLRRLLGHTAGMGVPFYPGYLQGDQMPTLLQVLDGDRPAVTLLSGTRQVGGDEARTTPSTRWVGRSSKPGN